MEDIGDNLELLKEIVVKGTLLQPDNRQPTK